MATSTSYLQTLSPAEASAFITSLEQVQGHLQQELAWMNQQVQQKTVQLQGIETLLVEASTFGLLETDADMNAAPVAADAEAKTEPMAALATTEDAGPPAAPPSMADDSAAIAETSADIPAKETASFPESVAAAPEATQGKQTASKPPAKAKPQKSSSSKATTKKQSNTKAQSRSKASKAPAQPKSRALLRPKFADETLTDAVTQVLTQAGEPTHIDQIVSELYEDVSGEDLKRIKGALANVLSKGKRSGKWRNVGNGVYQIKA